MNSISIGTCIRDLRKSKGIKATFVANKIGISYSHLWKIENGSPVRADLLYQIASILGVEVGYFFEHSIAKNATRSEVENETAI